MDDYSSSISPEAKRALEASWANGMPPMASAAYARWWQLETWLRSLVYVELRTALGDKWIQALPQNSGLRQSREDEFRYMQTADAQSRLAYADASALMKITQDNWELFEKYVLARNVWSGRIEELCAIRNRIGHCRRPHADDLARLEQTLRDLEHGAFVAASAFNRQWTVHKDWTDEVVEGWHHIDAHLVSHANRQYETGFHLRFSRRPWGRRPAELPAISGLPGYIWHAAWTFRGERSIDLSGFWRDIGPHHDEILLVCCNGPHAIEVSLPAVSNPSTVSEVIGRCFYAVLENLTPTGRSVDYAEWNTRYVELDTRVQVNSIWSLVEDSMQRHGVSIFGA